MTPFLVRPLDPLVFGVGRPFSAIPGGRLESMPLPPPSTLAGTVRTLAGLDAEGRFDTGRINELLQHSIVGPWLVVDGPSPKLALPAPADALRLRHDDKHQIRRLVPLRLEAGEHVSTDWLAPVGQPSPERAKPPRGAPSHWQISELMRWLTDPPAPDEPYIVEPSWGVEGPVTERRVHVRVDPVSRTADDGGLFSTDGQRFRGCVDGKPAELALYGETDADLTLPTHAVIGGEGRLSRVEQTERSLLPSLPEAVVESARKGFVRAYLATPAPLGGSMWEPEGATVVAQANGRPLVVSGWQMAPMEPDARYVVARNRRRSGGGPKPTRRLLPAGTVFFLELSGDVPAREAFVRTHWGRSIAAGQDARDGFGIVLFGAWNGDRHPLTIEDSP